MRWGGCGGAWVGGWVGGGWVEGGQVGWVPRGGRRVGGGRQGARGHGRVLGGWGGWGGLAWAWTSAHRLGGAGLGVGAVRVKHVVMIGWGKLVDSVIHHVTARRGRREGGREGGVVCVSGWGGVGCSARAERTPACKRAQQARARTHARTRRGTRAHMRRGTRAHMRRGTRALMRRGTRAHRMLMAWVMLPPLMVPPATLYSAHGKAKSMKMEAGSISTQISQFWMSTPAHGSVCVVCLWVGVWVCVRGGEGGWGAEGGARVRLPPRTQCSTTHPTPAPPPPPPACPPHPARRRSPPPLTWRWR